MYDTRRTRNMSHAAPGEKGTTTICVGKSPSLPRNWDDYAVVLEPTEPRAVLIWPVHLAINLFCDSIGSMMPK